LEQIEALAKDVGDDYLRIELDEPARAGLAEQVRSILPEAVEVRLVAVEVDGQKVTPLRLGRDPGELFREYLVFRKVQDRRLEVLFDELLVEVQHPVDV
jgi:exonuclease SbcD